MLLASHHRKMSRSTRKEENNSIRDITLVMQRMRKQKRDAVREAGQKIQEQRTNPQSREGN